MSNELSADDAQKLFNEVSQSIRSNDVLKLDELVEAKPVEGNPSEEVPPAADDEPQEEETSQETPGSDEEEGTKETTPPADEPAEVQPEEKGKEEPEELATLRAQLEAIKKENHHLKSQAGRMPHLQSKVRDLDKKLEQLRAQLHSPSSQPSAKILPEVQKKLAKIRESDAELADAMEASIAAATDVAAREQIVAQISEIEAARKAEYEAYHKAEWSRLVEAVPNAQDIFKSPHWGKWKEGQTSAMQQLAGSDNADDVIFAIRRYEADMLEQYPELRQKETPPAGGKTPEEIAAEAAEKARQVEAARQQRRETSVVTGTPNAAAQTQQPSDAAALFKKFSEQIRKDRLG